MGHDGSMIRLAAGLGLGHASNGGTLRWPAMGSEIVMEVSKRRGVVNPYDLFGRFGGIRVVGGLSVFCTRVHPCRVFDGSSWENLSICLAASYQQIFIGHAPNNRRSVHYRRR